MRILTGDTQEKRLDLMPREVFPVKYTNVSL